MNKSINSIADSDDSSSQTLSRPVAEMNSTSITSGYGRHNSNSSTYSCSNDSDFVENSSNGNSESSNDNSSGYGTSNISISEISALCKDLSNDDFGSQRRSSESRGLLTVSSSKSVVSKRHRNTIHSSKPTQRESTIKLAT